MLRVVENDWDYIDLGLVFRQTLSSRRSKLHFAHQFVKASRSVRFHDAEGDVDATIDVGIWLVEQYFKQVSVAESQVLSGAVGEEAMESIEYQ